jgi:hypothetical protein
METILPPQQTCSFSINFGDEVKGAGELTPTTPQVLIEEYLASISFNVPGTFAAVFGGAPVVWKKLPRAFPFSSLSGGYLSFLLAIILKVKFQAEVGVNSPRDISWIALEPIGHEDLVLVVLVRGREDISSLERLREVSEDVVNVEDGFGSICWAGDIYALK